MPLASREILGTVTEDSVTFESAADLHADEKWILTKSEQPLITRFTRPPNQIPNMTLGKLIVTYIVRNHPLCAKLLDDLRNLLGAGRV